MAEKSLAARVAERTTDQALQLLVVELEGTQAAMLLVSTTLTQEITELQKLLSEIEGLKKRLEVLENAS